MEATFQALNLGIYVCKTLIKVVHNTTTPAPPFSERETTSHPCQTARARGRPYNIGNGGNEMKHGKNHSQIGIRGGKGTEGGRGRQSGKLGERGERGKGGGRYWDIPYSARVSRFKPQIHFARF